VAVQRPEANEGGREEEERRFGIATRRTGRLHGMKLDTPAEADRMRRDGSPTRRAYGSVTRHVRRSSIGGLNAEWWLNMLI
jgi:hypothetical protein